MNIVNYITADLLPGLRELWKTAFGDDDEFLDKFYSLAFAPERCRCITEDRKVLAALYWFDTFCEGKKLAYVYAVATDPACRNQGLCRRLMADTRSALTARGYAGILLVPVTPDLVRMYEKLGYTPCTTVSEFWCGPRIPAAPLHRTDSATYALTRAALLPSGSVLQEGENLAFLESQAALYTGPGFAAAITVEGDKLHCLELLGDISAAPHILKALGCSYGFFRCPGKGKDYAMLCPLSDDCPTPAYFGFAFD